MNDLCVFRKDQCNSERCCESDDPGESQEDVLPDDLGYATVNLSPHQGLRTSVNPACHTVLGPEANHTKSKPALSIATWSVTC